MSENGIGKALGGGGSGCGSGSGRRPSCASASSAPPSSFNLFQAGFDATWELDLFGKVAPQHRGRRRRRARGRGSARRRAGLARRRGRTHLLRLARQRAPARDRAGRRRRPQARLQRLVESRSRSGLAPRVGRRGAGTRRSTAARAQLPPLEQAIAQAANRLALLLAHAAGRASPAWLGAGRRCQRCRPRCRSACRRAAAPPPRHPPARGRARGGDGARRRRHGGALSEHPARRHRRPAGDASGRPVRLGVALLPRPAPSSRFRSSRAAGCTRRCASPTCRRSRPCSPIGRRCWRHSTTSTTR